MDKINLIPIYQSQQHKATTVCVGVLVYWVRVRAKDRVKDRVRLRIRVRVRKTKIEDKDPLLRSSALVVFYLCPLPVSSCPVLLFSLGTFCLCLCLIFYVFCLLPFVFTFYLCVRAALSVFVCLTVCIYGYARLVSLSLSVSYVFSVSDFS
jgi:hypothetical protein